MYHTFYFYYSKIIYIFLKKNTEEHMGSIYATNIKQIFFLRADLSRVLIGITRNNYIYNLRINIIFLHNNYYNL